MAAQANMTMVKSGGAQLATRQESAAIMERVVVVGDLSQLTPEERVRYYMEKCESLGLNPLSEPFQYIVLDKKLTLYVTRTATDQLRETKGVSVEIVRRDINTELGIYTVEVKATTPDGRVDFSTGVVPIAKEDGTWEKYVDRSGQERSRWKGNGQWTTLRGADLANALMRCETKAKRRVTLSVVGLGWMDESELDTVPSARPVRVDMATGEIVDAPPPIEQPRAAQTTSSTAEPTTSPLMDIPPIDIPDDIQKASRETLTDMWINQWEEAQSLGIPMQYSSVPKGMKPPQVREELARRRARINAEFERQRQQAVADTVPDYTGGEPGETETPF